MKPGIHFLQIAVAMCLSLVAASASGQVGYATTAVAPVALAQTGGPYFGDMERGLFYPSYLQRDAAAIAEELGLGEEERVLVEILIERYVNQFQQEAGAVQLAMAEAAGGVIDEMPDLDERRMVRSEAREAMRIKADPTKLGTTSRNSEERRERINKVIRRELKMASASLPETQRTRLLRDWGVRRQQLESDLLAEFSLIKGADSEHWEAVDRAIRRLNSAWREQFRAEETDLDLILAQHFGMETAIFSNLRPQRLEYATGYDELLQNRDSILATTTPDLLDSRDRTNIGKVLTLIDQQLEARGALVDFNLQWLDRFCEAIPEGAARDGFRSYALKEIFPDLHRGDPPTMTVDYLLQNGNLDPELVESLLEIRDNYKADVWRIVAIELRSEQEQDRLRHELQSNIVMLVYPTWLNGLNLTPQSLIGWRDHLQSGLEIDLDYNRQIKQLVSAQVYGQVPGRFRTPRSGDARRGPVPNSSSRRMNVVYWDELMRDNR